MKKLSREEALKQINEFFSEVKSKTPKEVKKIKRLAMRYNIPLREFRKTFCKRCFSPYVNSKVRANNKKKVVECSNCEGVGRWKIK